MLLKPLVKSLPALSNWQTIVISFFIEPLFTLFFFILVQDSTFEADDVLRFISLVTEIQFLMVLAQVLVTSKQNGLIEPLLLLRKGFLFYLLAVIMIAFFLSLTGGIAFIFIFSIAVTAIHLCFSGVLLSLIVMLVLLVPLCLSFSLFWWKSSNPYFGSNLLIGLLPIVSAAIVPITQYPGWLRWISFLFPFWMLPTVLTGLPVNWVVILGYVVEDAVLLFISIRHVKIQR